YRSKGQAFDLLESSGRLFHLPARGGFRAEVRRLDSDLVLDDRLAQGVKIERDGDDLRLGKTVYRRVEVDKPADIPAKWRGLIGEYGPDHLKLVVLEKDGKLHALVEWFFLYPLEEESEDVYRFPREFGLYHDEKL